MPAGQSVERSECGFSVRTASLSLPGARGGNRRGSAASIARPDTPVDPQGATGVDAGLPYPPHATAGALSSSRTSTTRRECGPTPSPTPPQSTVVPSRSANPTCPAKGTGRFTVATL